MNLVKSQKRDVCRFHVCSPTPDVRYITLSVDDEPASLSIEDIYRRICSDLEGFEVVHERIFASQSGLNTILEARGRLFNDNRPYTFIQGNPVWGEGLAGIQLLAVRPGNQVEKVWTISESGVPCGRAWKRDGVTFMLMHNISSSEPGSSPSEQARQMFERADRILASQGATYKDIARTWLYLSKILDWYSDFNAVRNDEYHKFGIMPEQSENHIPLPASTGIEGDNPLGAACTMDALAIVRNGAAPSPRVTQMSNPRQKDAFKYKSAFSRAACIEHPDFTEIQLSGTASIDETGATCFVDDFAAQMELTLDNIADLLALKGATLKDICSATVFLKRKSDLDTYRAILSKRSLEDLPAVCTVADVCRDDLLFELDGIVIKK